MAYLGFPSKIDGGSEEESSAGGRTSFTLCHKKFSNFIARKQKPINQNTQNKTVGRERERSSTQKSLLILFH